MYDRYHPNYPGPQPTPSYEDVMEAAYRDDVMDNHLDTLVVAAKAALTAKEAHDTSHHIYTSLAEAIDEAFYETFEVYGVELEPDVHEQAFKRAQHEMKIENARAAA